MWYIQYVFIDPAIVPRPVFVLAADGEEGRLERKEGSLRRNIWLFSGLIKFTGCRGKTVKQIIRETLCYTDHEYNRWYKVS